MGLFEVLFIDLAKDWSINDHVARLFFPSLIPGQSVVIQQDYVHEVDAVAAHYYGAFGYVFMYCGSVPYSSGLFVPRRKIRAEELPANLFADVPHDESLLFSIARLSDLTVKTGEWSNALGLTFCMRSGDRMRSGRTLMR